MLHRWVCLPDVLELLDPLKGHQDALLLLLLLQLSDH
jgi:hypothetical protein